MTGLRSDSAQCGRKPENSRKKLAQGTAEGN